MTAVSYESATMSNMMAADPTCPSRRANRERILGIVVGALTIAVLAAGLRWPLYDPLARVARRGRAVESRLTGIAYSVPMGARAGATVDSRTLSAMADLEAHVAQERTPLNLHRLAVAELAAGRFGSAHGLLTEALRLQPDDVNLMSDLAAAQLALGRVADAAEESARVLQRDATHQSAAFNWALALERLSNRPAAIAAWENYLTLGSDGGWTVEAREHLTRLRSRRPDWNRDGKLLRAGVDVRTARTLTAQYPQHVRALVQDELLLKWVDGGRPDELALLHTIASARAEAGDPFLLDVVDHAVRNRESVVAGVHEFAEARDASRKRDRDQAAVRFANAAELLDHAGSPLAIAAAINAATQDLYRGRSEVALKRLAEVDQRAAASGNRYPAMASESAWVRGLLLAPRGDPQGSLDSYRHALAEAKRAGETEHEVAIGELIATQLELVGDPAEAEQARSDALRRSDEINADPGRMYVAFYETAFSALRMNRPRLAIAFLESAAEIARAQKDSQLLAETSAQRALALLEIGKTSEAAANIQVARTRARLIETSGFRDRAAADVEDVAGRIEQVQGRHSQAITAYTAAIDIWERRGWHLHLAHGRLARGEAALAAGDRAAAERDFRAGIADMEAQRSNVEEEAARVAYFERADRLFERLIEVLADGGRPVDALTIAEHKQSRALLDSIAASGGGADSPMGGDDIAAALDPGVAILELVLLDRGAELWLIHHGTVTHARSVASGAAIEESASRHRAAIEEHDDAAARREGRWLFDQLIAPLGADIRPGMKLVIVADGGLRTFPFATLVAPNEEYLLERHTLVTAPSATVFLRLPSKAVGETLLAVAQPAPQGFPLLPDAAAEASGIARSSPHGRVLIGKDVNPATFLALAEDAACVHFAGHAETDVQHPSRSALVFESAGGAGRLSAREIAVSHLRAHPLVVLAACSTGRGRVRRNEGVDSLGTAFLRAGARGVVATLWNIDDESSAMLFRSFHENLRRGAVPANALRDAQRGLLHSFNPRYRSPSTWGAAVMVGTR
jgi:CHAT domain-containing protein